MLVFQLPDRSPQLLDADAVGVELDHNVTQNSVDGSPQHTVQCGQSALEGIGVPVGRVGTMYAAGLNVGPPAQRPDLRTEGVGASGPHGARHQRGQEPAVRQSHISYHSAPEGWPNPIRRTVT